MQQQTRRHLQVRFSHPWPKNSKRPAKSFRENRPPYRKSSKYYQRKLRQQGLKQKKRQVEQRSLSPFFYESLMMPFCCHQTWRYASIIFDREPRPKNTSFASTFTTVKGCKWVQYHGYKALGFAVWAYCELLMNNGEMKEGYMDLQPVSKSTNNILPNMPAVNLGSGHSAHS
jgi:hypothetical protein